MVPVIAVEGKFPKIWYHHNVICSDTLTTTIALNNRNCCLARSYLLYSIYSGRKRELGCGSMWECLKVGKTRDIKVNKARRKWSQSDSTATSELIENHLFGALLRHILFKLLLNLLPEEMLLNWAKLQDMKMSSINFYSLFLMVRWLANSSGKPSGENRSVFFPSRYSQLILPIVF